MASLKGRFKPTNPKKYIGDPTNIVWRSKMELRFMLFLDTHESVLEWASEETWIPYYSPKEKKTRRYFPDFIVKFIDTNNQTVTKVIEIKPAKETVQPTPKRTESGRYSKTYLREAFIWSINDAKWAAARQYCEHKGYEFVIITEKDLKANGL